MSQAPPTYTPAANFHTLAAVPYTATGLPGSELDAEFANLAASMLATQARLAELQRDDGAVKNGVVGFLAMSADVLAAFSSIGSNYRGAWSAGQTYKTGDLVISAADNYPYLCGIGHTSSVSFDGDFSSGVWAIMGYRPATDTLVVNTLSGTGTQTVFTLTKAPVNAANTLVHVAGAYQKKSLYTVAGTILTFVTAPASGTANIEVVIGVSAQLINNVVTIPNNSVGTAAIIDGNVTTGKLADAAVASAKLADLGVTTGKLADLGVTTAKLSALAVTSDKIAGASIDSSKMATGSVQTSSIQAGAVVAASIGTGAVVANALAAGAVVAGKLGAAAVATDNLADLAVTTAKLGEGAVTLEKMAAGAVGIAALAFPAGFPVQVVQSVLDTYFQTLTLTAWVDIPGLSIPITRFRTTSKIRVQAAINVLLSQSSWPYLRLRIVRDGTPVGVPTGTLGTECTTVVGSAMANGGIIQTAVTIDFIDALPADALPHTYKLQMYVVDNQNRINATTYGKPISTLTLTEITS